MKELTKEEFESLSENEKLEYLSYLDNKLGTVDGMVFLKNLGKLEKIFMKEELGKKVPELEISCPVKLFTKGVDYGAK